MRRTALLVLLTLGIVLALGATRGRKFKFLSDRWNRPANLAEIELACLRSCFEARQQVPLLDGHLSATEIRAVAQPTHLRVTVWMRASGDKARPPSLSDLERACAAAQRYWRQELFKRPLPAATQCPLTIDLILGTKTVYREINDRNGRRGFLNPPV